MARRHCATSGAALHGHGLLALVELVKRASLLQGMLRWNASSKPLPFPSPFCRVMGLERFGLRATTLKFHAHWPTGQQREQLGQQGRLGQQGTQIGRASCRERV